MKIEVWDGHGSIYMQDAKIRRIAKEGGSIRLSFNDKNNCIRLDLNIFEACILKEKLNQRKDL